MVPDSLPATLRLTLTSPLRLVWRGTVHDAETFGNRKHFVPENSTLISSVPKANTPIALAGALPALNVISWDSVLLLVTMWSAPARIGPQVERIGVNKQG